MNLLIIGGLLVVALAATVGIVFLAMGESRTQRSSAPSTPQAAVTTRLPEIHEPAPGVARQTSTPPPQRSLAPMETSLPTRRPTQPLARLNGQIHELVVELRSLHQQAEEIEQRLQVLTEFVERLEQSQSGQVSIEEETIPIPSADNTLT